MIKKFFFGLLTILTLILVTRTYSSYQKNKATEIDGCYYSGRVYKAGEHYKPCNDCICLTSTTFQPDLRISCVEMPCDSFWNLPLVQFILNVFFVK